MIKLALCQNIATGDRWETLDRVERLVKEAAARGADFAVLPEMFICPYSARYFQAEAILGHEEITARLAALARQYSMYVVGGSIPEMEDYCCYNSCFVFDRAGRQIARHRKVHLYDADVLGMHVRESASFRPGNDITVFDTEFGPMGVAICYDLRFPEMFRAMARRGAKLIFVPAQFNLSSGPKHWDLLLRARAVDYQVFVAGAQAARNPEVRYQCWGHSAVYDPAGQCVARGGEEEGPVFAELDLERVTEEQALLPIQKALRRDLYSVSE